MGNACCRERDSLDPEHDHVSDWKDALTIDRSAGSQRSKLRKEYERLGLVLEEVPETDREYESSSSDVIFKVDPRHINRCERALRVNFTPLGLKTVIDSWCVPEPNPKKWTVRMDDPVIKIWTCEEGFYPEPDLPVF